MQAGTLGPPPGAPHRTPPPDLPPGAKPEDFGGAQTLLYTTDVFAFTEQGPFKLPGVSDKFLTAVPRVSRTTREEAGVVCGEHSPFLHQTEQVGPGGGGPGVGSAGGSLQVEQDFNIRDTDVW